MTDTSKMRSEFEAAWRVRYPDHGESAFIRSHLEPDSYVASRVKDAWWAWQASRQAVVVELPEPWAHYGIMGDVNDPDMVLDHSSVVEAIEAAGLRCEVKP
ncbi:hypothetical protein OH708_08260 [Pseudomonas capsici]|uniref:hypothetical protein n=1 Tax=Pseudomonas capsici TaxID=2810614 RepID=UPI0021F0BF94|nr:hypothetical protein [Pseudomonas capsici]MCV4287895.1 hypothetical protein [Pseudomonas capsici]